MSEEIILYPKAFRRAALKSCILKNVPIHCRFRFEKNFYIRRSPGMAYRRCQNGEYEFIEIDNVSMDNFVAIDGKVETI